MGLGLIGVGISMVVGNFVGVILGVGLGRLGWVKGLILVEGRGCLAYPIFSLENIPIFGNYPHFSA